MKKPVGCNRRAKFGVLRVSLFTRRCVLTVIISSSFGECKSRQRSSRPPFGGFFAFCRKSKPRPLRVARGVWALGAWIGLVIMIARSQLEAKPSLAALRKRVEAAKEGGDYGAFWTRGVVICWRRLPFTALGGKRTIGKPIAAGRRTNESWPTQ